MNRGDNWYPRDPRRFMDGCRSAKLTIRQWAIYGLIIDLIYDHGGETDNDPKFIAGHFPDVGSAIVRREIDYLVSIGKLRSNGEILTNELATNVTETQRKLSENRKETGKKGGISSGFSRRKSIKNKHLAEPIASTKNELEENRIEDIEKETPNGVSKKKTGTRLPTDWFLPKDWGEWAVGKGHSHDEVRTQAERFKNHWLAKAGKDAAKLDWLATWRNWITSPYNVKGNGNGKLPGQRTLDIIEAAARGSKDAEDFGDQGGSHSQHLLARH